MLRFLIALACLLIIDEYIFRLRRRYIERRQLRAWQKRVRPLTPPGTAAPAPKPDPARGPGRWAALVFVIVMIAAAVVLLAESDPAPAASAASPAATASCAGDLGARVDAGHCQANEDSP